mmetsp:Transcript_35712/g.48239  ORF Transcript_35712/g.48239 Transcript_35712/m.48239 type:complete len:81 (-) Transcript_35712:311-553(-)
MFVLIAGCLVHLCLSVPSIFFDFMNPYFFKPNRRPRADGMNLPKILPAIAEKNVCRPATVPNVTNTHAYTGETQMILAMR